MMIRDDVNCPHGVPMNLACAGCAKAYWTWDKVTYKSPTGETQVTVPYGGPTYHEPFSWFFWGFVAGSVVTFLVTIIWVFG